MFWRFGGYANISTIDTILDKPEFTLEELLDEGDLIQEVKQHNSKLLDYLRQRDVLAKLLEYVVVPKLEPVAVYDDEEAEDDANVKGKGRALPFGRARASPGATDFGNEGEEAEKKKNKYAYVACEILSSDNWSICEVLMEPGSRDLLFKFWEFLKRPTPLDPLQASYFTKVNESLFDKKTEEMIEFLKKVTNAVPDMLRHVDCPMIMDLLLKIISLERTAGGIGIVEWLYCKDLMPSLLSFLDPKNTWATQTSAGDFLKAIITVSANASQNEQTCIGPNELTRQLVSRPCVSQLIGYMLGGGNALTVGVGIVIEVIRKNNSDYDPDMGADPTAVPSSRDPIYLGTLLRMFADNVPNFITLVQNAPAQKFRLQSTSGDKIEPLGFDRFKTCELMAELLHCSNMGLLNEVGAEALIATRDLDRQLLREEGRLISAPVEDLPPDIEDILLRTAGEPEEFRRLEVTNATDDDGFEEVTHSGEVGEDTSHEFVKAEDELPSNSPALFLGKDEDDDFVEGPLSSPRLRVHDVPPTDAQFEDPDMVVAPLSPSKKKPASSPEKGFSPAEDTHEKIEDLILDEKQQTEPANDSSADQDSEPVSVEKEPADDLESPIMFAPTVPMERPEDLNVETTADLGSSTGQEAPIVDELSPHPEDTPTPLFSKSPAKPAKSTVETFASDKANEKAAPSEARETEGAETKTAEESTNMSSISGVEANSEAPVPSAEAADLPPVVGDFLKRQFVEHRVVPTILSFFFSYPWNNFLHNVVYDIVQQVFNGPMDRGFNPILAISLFEGADVTNRIIKGQRVSEESQSQNKTRMGYMGHLTLIAEEVVKFTERHPPELLSDIVLEKVMAQDWVSYVEGALAETRERDNAILGGVRPEVALSNRAAASGLAGIGLSGLGSALGLCSQGSSALADAGLNGGLEQGNGDASVGPFSISAAISSGFHSSSDEDGDDAEDNDEDVNQEFRAYTDPLNALSNHPPSIPPPPPPPPPLNIPPSRARLQLAARLAMNKRNAAAASATHGNGGSGAEGSDAAVRSPDADSTSPGLLQPAPVVQRLRNPFADDADDEDDEDDADREDEEGLASGWNRGGWWRGVVRRRGERGEEKFGDGRDDETDSEGDDEDVVEDEEFGDFAMPEDREGGEAGGQGAAAGFDKERERVLLKPLPVHPPLAGSSKFGSLWPFGKKEDEGREEGIGAAKGEGKPDEEVVIGEDGKRVVKAKEAKSRRSLDDPDDEEVVL